VTLAVSCADETEGSVSVSGLTFTPADWDRPQAVIVTGVDDPVDDGDVPYLIVTGAAASPDSAYQGLDPADVAVTNLDDDTAGIAIDPRSGLTTTESGGTAEFSVSLTSQPSASVSLGVSSSDPTEGIVAPASLTFTPSDWDVAQTVTVTGVDDGIADGPVGYAVVTAPATSTDPAYAGLDPPNVSVVNTDNDVTGFIVTPTSGLITTEAGGTAQFTVVLVSPPTSNVAVSVSTSDPTEGTTSTSNLVFTVGNWNNPHTVTVTGVDDAVDDGDIAYTVVTGVATSADPNYRGLDPPDVSVTNTDNDAVGITVSPTAGLVTTESGGTAKFTVVLTSQPVGNVTVGLASTDLTEGTVSPATLTFTPVNWNVAQTVTVTGVDDPVDDGAAYYTIVTGPATSTDPGYNGIDPADVSVRNNDNDSAGFTVNPSSGLSTTEAGGTAQFTIALTSQPTASVTVEISSSDPSEGSVSPASLLFTETDWDKAQTVTVTGVDDPIVDGPVAYTVVTAPAASADGRYQGRNPANVSVVNSDDDVAGVAVTPVAGLVTTEGGGTARFTVVLGSRPTSDVMIGFTSSDTTEGTVTPANLTITPDAWDIPHTVTVTGADDALDDGDVIYRVVTSGLVSSDGNYAGIDPPDVEVLNQDDDTGLAVALELTADRGHASAGQPVRFTLSVRNLTPLPLARLEVRCEPPVRFGYLAGSAVLDGRPIPDPPGGRPVVIAIDSLPGFADLDGDGIADPGESGYMSVAWSLAPGASARPGVHSSEAVVRSLDACGGCVVSNRAEATIRVDEDGTFAHGILLGRVFEDRDRDGRQGPGEPGVPDAWVALDDGTRAATDADGRFHVPALDPGPRAVKLDVAGLGMPAVPTTDATQIVNVSPGLLTTVRFGVAILRDTVSTGPSGGEGLAIIVDPVEQAVHVAGNAYHGSAVVNGRAVSVRSVDAKLATGDSEQILRMTDAGLDSAAFIPELSDTTGVLRWWLEVRDGRQEAVRLFEGEGRPPVRVRCGGDRSADRRWRAGEVYAFQIHVAYGDGTVVDGPRRAFGVERGPAMALTLAGDAFQPDRAVLTLAASEPLVRFGRAMLNAPREVVIVEGHTDSIGSAAGNRRLSQERAQAVADFLASRMGIPRGRLIVEGHGGARPVASNETEDGRELNRRVELYAMSSQIKRARLYEVFHGTASARVDDLNVPVDEAGGFACRVPLAGPDTLQVTMTNRFGRTAVARVRMPSLEILEPTGELLMPFGESTDGVRVEPRSAVPGAAEALASLGGAHGAPLAARVRLRGRTDAGNHVEIDGEPAVVAPDGTFVAELSLHVGANAFGLVVRDPAGTQREASLIVRALDRQVDRADLAALGRIPEVTVHLPPAGSVLGSRELRLAGRTRPGHRVTINRDTVGVDPDGRFLARVMLPEGPSVLTVAVEDSLGRRHVVERAVEVRSKRLFLVGLADGVVGRSARGAFVEAGEGGRTWTEGRIAYQLKGWIAGRYLITSAFDTQRRDFATLFRDLDDAGRDRLMVNLDPDRLYPVFGDAGAVTHGAPGGGRFFLAVESEVVRASVGDFPIAFDDVELAAFHRTLYGGQLRLARGGKGVVPGTSVALFGAEARHVHVRDALRATGGTLYYLSHRDAIEGSLQAAVVIHDRDTGLPLRRISLQRGVDFSAKELEGRILLANPIPGTWEDASLVDGGRLVGHPVTIELDYETRGSLSEKAAVGGRVRQTAGPLTLGATALDDRANGGEYRLRGADATLRLGDASRLGFEAARSEGRTGLTYASADGGLGFVRADTAAVGAGRAWKVTAELAPGDWHAGLARLRLGGYVRQVEPGFAAEDHPGGERREQAGLRARFDAGRWGQLHARLDRDERGEVDSTAVGTRELLGVLWSLDGRRVGVASEFEQRRISAFGMPDSLSGTVAGRFWWRPVRPLRATVERQQSLSGTGSDRTGIGLDLQVASGLALGARGTIAAGERTVRGDATLSLGRRRAYLREERSDAPGRRASGTVFGIQSPLGPAGRTYTEYQWQRDASGERALSVMGIEQGWRPHDGLELCVAGEHGTRAGLAGEAAGRRTTLSSAISYRGGLPVSGETRGEIRTDGGPARQRQILLATRLEWTLRPGIALRGNYRLSHARMPDLGVTPARFEERSVGMAIRPTRSDRVQALARLTRLDDRRPGAPGDTLLWESGLDVAALEASLRLTHDLEWSGKGAARVLRDGPGGLPAVTTHGRLWVSRIDYRIFRPVRLGVEYRLLTQRETGDRQRGWLQELSLDPSRNLRFGVGYNFTRFSGDVLDRGVEDRKGWFVRAQSRY